MSSSDKKGKKRSKKYYIQAAKKSKKFTLDVGMKGFLMTCDREKECVREAYNLLNEYADQLYGPEKTEEAEPQDADDDIGDALLKEIKDMVQVKKTMRRFQVMDSGAKHCIFIHTTVDDPCHLVHHILNEAYTRKLQKSRYILRFLPVSATCRARIETIVETTEQLLLLHPDLGFGCAGGSFCVMVKIRNSNQVTQTEVIQKIVAKAREMNDNNAGNMQNPDFFIIVDVIKTTCCLSIVKDYFKFKKYNLQQVSVDENTIQKSKESNKTEESVSELEECKSKESTADCEEANKTVETDNSKCGVSNETEESIQKCTESKESAGESEELDDDKTAVK